jgi:hypothetical protein
MRDVPRDDYKEGERRKLNDEMRAAADAWSASNPKARHLPATGVQPQRVPAAGHAA